jgi:hypothetical protein
MEFNKLIYGMDPAKELKERLKDGRAVTLPISLGMDPTKDLELKKPRL